MVESSLFSPLVVDSNVSDGPDLFHSDNSDIDTTGCFAQCPDPLLAGGCHDLIGEYTPSPPARVQLDNQYGRHETASEQLVHFAAETGHIQTVQLLVNRGGNVNEIDTIGRTPLHLAAKYGHVKMVSRLLQLGADARVLDHLGWSAVHYAIQRGCTDCMEVLLEQGPDVV